MLRTPFCPVYHKMTKLLKDSTKLCFASRTIFGDYILLIVYVNKHPAGVNVCDWEIRGSSEKVVATLTKNKADWFRELTNGMTVLQEGNFFIVFH